ncbi:DUF4337 domain-containing protein [Tumidithrix elongata RA019]|uniref:DUF4337 domain-containing protein n=1 Tax=Tumidithrix elongata BACA0141 TaxID=2716417 RepID=A0AAW9QA10_9CYAN|nr:DUF4337 domain-containing protein [Tumidithrix elongata RA019]
MDVNPMEIVEAENDSNAEKEKEKKKSRLNTYVAIAVALLATFIGVCKVKDDNIVQAMQQAQANRIDDWGLYQARNIRTEIAQATIAQLELQALSQPKDIRQAYQKKIAYYQELSDRENKKKLEEKAKAENDQKTYDQLNFHDDQFDLADASLAIAISLFALTSLTQKRWLFGIAMVPTAFGVLMGLAGLLNWGIHPDALTNLLSDSSLTQPPSTLISVDDRTEATSLNRTL